MVKIVRRLLKLLLKFRIYKHCYKITYDGEMSSANKVWSSPHWSARSAMKNKYSDIFSILFLQAKIKPIEEMVIVLFYNSRLDVDNTCSGCKVFADSIKGKYIKDDSPRFYKGLFLIYDSDLPKNQYEFQIICK